jgi:putative oxidoreductase
MSNTLKFGGLFGRILMAANFLMAGVGKVMDPVGTEQFMAAHEMVATRLFLVMAILFELGAGTCLLIGYRTHEAAVALIVFLVPATVILHNFWAVNADVRMDQMQHFLKNVAILGGLTTLAVTGAVGWAVDNMPARVRSADTTTTGGGLVT